MEVPLTPDLQAKLRRLAAQQGRASESLVIEAIERLVCYDEWFLGEVEKGISAADKGQLRDHKEIGNLIEGRYPG